MDTPQNDRHGAEPVTAVVAQPSPTFFAQNVGSLIVFAVIGAYLVLAAFTGIVMAGAIPLLGAMSAVRRREPLAMAAFVATAVAVVGALAGI